MFAQSIKYYDQIYAFKDYQSEASRLISLIRTHMPHTRLRLLDVACGTGRHLEYLKQAASCQGLELEDSFAAIARKRNPDIEIFQGDMRTFQISRTWNVITCLFSSIGYLLTDVDLEQTLNNFYRHLETNGRVIIEPWISPESFIPDNVHAIFIDQPDLKIARINNSIRDGDCSILDLHYLVGTPVSTEHFLETHKLRMLSQHELINALDDSGFEVEFIPEGLTGRGLYIGRKT